MAFGTITSANATLMLSVQGVFSNPVQIQGFGVDDAFTMADIAPTGVEMGVDGFMASGYTPVVQPFSMMLLASSPSGYFFDQWLQAIRAAQESLPCTGSLALPSLGTKYNMINGALTGMKVGPDGKKMLMGRPFTITFQQITSGPSA